MSKFIDDIIAKLDKELDDMLTLETEPAPKQASPRSDAAASSHIAGSLPAVLTDTLDFEPVDISGWEKPVPSFELECTLEAAEIEVSRLKARRKTHPNCGETAIMLNSIGNSVFRTRFFLKYDRFPNWRDYGDNFAIPDTF